MQLALGTTSITAPRHWLMPGKSCLCSYCRPFPKWHIGLAPAIPYWGAAGHYPALSRHSILCVMCILSDSICILAYITPFHPIFSTRSIFNFGLFRPSLWPLLAGCFAHIKSMSVQYSNVAHKSNYFPCLGFVPVGYGLVTYWSRAVQRDISYISKPYLRRTVWLL